MIVVGNELAGALRAAHLCASTDETRPNLNCVHIEFMTNGLRLVSTDGHTMWCCEVPARDGPVSSAPPWNVGLVDVDVLIRRLKDVAEVEIIPATRTVQGKEIAQRADAGAFPPYRSVIPSIEATTPGDVLPEFATNYVARCCEALTYYSKGFAPPPLKQGSKDEKKAAQEVREGYLSPPIAWRVGKELDPAIFFSPKFPAAMCIVMPRKGDGSGRASVEAFINCIRSGGTTPTVETPVDTKPKMRSRSEAAAAKSGNA